MMSTKKPSDRVRATAEFISRTASEVSVDTEACSKAARFLFCQLGQSSYTPQSVTSSWCGSNGLHPPSPSPEALKWIFLIDTLNFCFWTPANKPPFTVLYKDKSYTGYWALCAAVNRAIDEGIPMTDPHFMTTVDSATLLHIFRSTTETQISLLAERQFALNEAGFVLTSKFDGSVRNLVDSAQGSAQTLIGLVVDNFSSYDDSLSSTSFLEHTSSLAQDAPSRLYLYKRAHILTADIWACFAATPEFSFNDIATLTMFADYRVPQTLVWLGALRYSPSLMAELHSKAVLPSGDPREVSIRGCSVLAVELIRSALDKLLQRADPDMLAIPINSILIDYLLWDYAKEHTDELAHIPIHRVLSFYY